MSTVRPADNEGVERILVVSAHPDDVDFGVAGSVATWTASGIDVSYCIVTDGDAGGSDLDLPRDEMASASPTGGCSGRARCGATCRE